MIVHKGLYMDIIIPSLASVISITTIGILFGLILSVAKIKLRVDRDPRYAKIVDALPGANCGACGQPGCSGYAIKILEGETELTLCPVGGAELVEKLAAIMGVAAHSMDPTKVRVRCQGGTGVTKFKFTYDGPRSCIAAQQIMGGHKVCSYGCLGLGDCERVCPFDAIHVKEKGFPEVDWDKCTGCGKCVEECPRNILSLTDERFGVHVMCLNKEKAKTMKLGCSVGCIACNRCVKACKEVFRDNEEIETAIEVIDFLAVIDYSKCINCGKCAEVCPQHVIEFRESPLIVRQMPEEEATETDDEDDTDEILD